MVYLLVLLAAGVLPLFVGFGIDDVQDAEAGADFVDDSGDDLFTGADMDTAEDEGLYDESL